MTQIAKRKPLPQSVRFVAGFIVPTFILLTLSDESRLGPFFGMLLSLAFPVAVELYALLSGRKQSLISFFAIIGILLIGAISLLGLSEQWLGLRRASIYVIGAVAVVGVLYFKREFVDSALGYIIDAGLVRSAARKKHTESLLARHIGKVGHLLAGLLLLVAAWSYVLTILVMTAPTGSSEFNAEYAKLRLYSIPLVTLPLLVGTVGLLLYFLAGLEKLTGIDADKLLKKKK